MSGAAATPSADALPSPNSLNGNRQPWDFSVPAASEPNNINSFSTKSRHSNDSSSTHQKSSHRHNTNGVSISRNSSRSGSRAGGAAEPTYLLPNRVDALGRKDPSLSRTGSEPDSLLELYTRDSANRSAVSVADSGEKTGDKRMSQVDGGGSENTNWIHRDKLARIESEELQQAGFQFQRQVRTGSKSSSRRGRSHDSHSNGVNGVVDPPEQLPPAREEAWHRISSPAPVEDVDEDIDDGEPISFDLRLPEEIAADEESRTAAFYEHPGLRKSSSRIPVLATSPVPIPTEHLERDFPLARTRNNTLGSGDNDSPYGKPRGLDETTYTAVDSADSAGSTPTPPVDSRPGSQSASRPGSSNNQSQGSPPKSKTQTRQPGTRKTSVPPNSRRTSGQQKPRAASGSSSTPNRPPTRSGPGPVNRPEGDPPWLATMYKPDPRLPPDQQILPTHARKLQQEQWDKDGKIPSTYDRKFAPLAIQNDDNQQPSLAVDPPPEQKTKEETDPSSWPLRPESPKGPDVNNRPGTSGTDHAGYKTIPKVQSPAPAPPPPSLNPVPRGRPSSEREKEKDKEKSCGCCVVM